MGKIKGVLLDGSRSRTIASAEAASVEVEFGGLNIVITGHTHKEGNTTTVSAKVIDGDSQDESIQFPLPADGLLRHLLLEVQVVHQKHERSFVVMRERRNRS